MKPSSNSKEILKRSVETLKGIGEKAATSLSKYNVHNIYDMIYFLPYRYEVLSQSFELDNGVLSGIYESHTFINAKNGKKVLRLLFRSDDGFIAALYLSYTFSYPLPLFKEGIKYNLYGNISSNKGVLSIFHPEIIPNSDINTVRAIYHLPAPLYQSTVRKAVKEALSLGLKEVKETLPNYLLDKYNLPSIQNSLQSIHTPKTSENSKLIMSRKHPSYQRLIYEELFYLNLLLARKRKNYKELEGISFDISKEYLNRIKEIMPFKLTSAQRRVLVEIFNDMHNIRQTNRLIQGDVGSGKTIVAFISAAISVMNGYQSTIIAPTEVLAEQHYNNFVKVFGNDMMKVELITGSKTKKVKDSIKQKLANNEIDILIGTHALLESDIVFNKLGLVVVDEQHRFGVDQRKKLIEKGSPVPDIVLMTATPIPRTLAMTLYSDLDISIIDEMPPGRIPPITEHYRESELNKVLDKVKLLLDKNEGAFFVYPLIDESEKIDLKAATQSYEYISKYYKDKKVGLLHGRLKSDEKRSLLDDFRNGVINVLVSTTVVEVGVDIPHATAMVIEQAERFGLSQLHQLRGRVGRSDLQSYCYLITSKDITPVGRERIKAMVQYNDGFKLAEIDLKLRGQGDLFGTKQSGGVELKYANIVEDVIMLRDANIDAKKYIETGVDDSVIEDRITVILNGEDSYIGIG